MNRAVKYIKLRVLKLMVLLLGVLCLSCIETYDFESEIETYESALVIEATLTDEQKLQEILVFRAYKLQESDPIPEREAIVKVLDSDHTEYEFKESDNLGSYVSTIPFAAQKNLTYTLSITTNTGKEYSSQPTKLTQMSKMDSLYAVRDFNEDGVEGMSIYVNSFDPSGNSKYYRHEYEESFKIIAPYWTDKDIVAVDYTSFDPVEEGYPVILVERPREEQVCYNTVISKAILVTSTVELDEDRLDKFRVRFISRDNYIISHRYSILVRQYVQSRASQAYYESLKLFSESENLFTENQPGFIEGNVFANEKQNEKVIGFFDVSSVDIQRIYFDYDDVFPNEELPPYANNCLFDAPPLYNPFRPDEVPPPLLRAVLSGNFKYYRPYIPQSNIEGPVMLVSRSCGDCTVLGKTEAPDFWIE